MKRIFAFALSALALASAQAYDINSAGDPALAGGSVVDFESVAAGAYGSVTAGGITFTAGAGTSLYVDSAYAGNYNTTGQSLKNTYNSDAFGLLTITFGAPTTSFGFNWGAADTVWTLSAYDASNNLLGSRSLTATGPSNAGEFYGLALGAGAAYATISGDHGDYVFVDNFTVGAVPEPETYALMVLGLVGLAAVKRGRRA